MHKEQREFCEQVKASLPEYFIKSRVIDFGSQDINGNNRYLFDASCSYTGIDIGPGRNVDIVCPCHKFRPEPGLEPDVVISTEMLEHDRHWKLSVKNMFQILKPGGLLIITCSTDGRSEHGTLEHNPLDSPHTLDYYMNVPVQQFREVLGRCTFMDCLIDVLKTDLRFWGIKL